jgi:hypothetical protein
MNKKKENNIGDECKIKKLHKGPILTNLTLVSNVTATTDFKVEWRIL